MSWQEILRSSESFMPHGHCYLWIPAILWMHVLSDLLIGVAYLGISAVLYALVRRIRLPFSPVFIAFGLFIGLCGMTHFLSVWTVWHPDYVLDGLVKSATALASVATAIGLFYVRPQVEEVVHAARLSEERRIRLETTHAELNALYLKVKELDELKTRFFTNVSHELRTPLSLILGPAERLLEDAPAGSDQYRQLDSIRRNGHALLRQVNELLDVAKLEAGKMELAYSRTDLARLVRGVLAQFEVQAEQRSLRLELSAPEQLPAECDPEKIERILVNLVSNAIKFTPAGGRIGVALAEDGTDIVLEVIDTGPGIDAAEQPAVFERFHQATGSSEHHRGGTGLGLAIVKEFAQLHRGSVSLHSAPDAGAAFTVRFPRQAPAGSSVARDDHVHARARVPDEAEFAPQQPQDETVAAGAGQPASAERPGVLVVEDNAELRQFVAHTLAGEYNVSTAADGREGLARASALLPDLVVSDIMMPHMGGDEMVRAMRGDPALAHVPVLLLSAQADAELRVALLRDGAQDYLVKPFLPQELLARVGNLVTLKRAGDTLRAELAVASGNVQALATDLAAKHRLLQVAFDAAELAREQAEQASLVKSQFLGLISHELRTPLATIKLNAELLGTAPPTFLTPENVVERAARLRRAAHQMGTLIEGVLEYAQADSARIVPRNEQVDLSALLDDVLSSHRELAPPGVTLERDRHSAGHGTVSTDPRLLSVVLSNLLSNALKFTEHGTVTAGLRQDGNHVRITIRDTGIGIAPEDLSRIFEPFEQLEPLRRKSIPGVGLGLALAKGTVEALGGRIEVSSAPGEGSTFSVCLPARQAATETI